MLNLEHYLTSLAVVNDDLNRKNAHLIGGLFLEESAPVSFVALFSPKNNSFSGRFGVLLGGVAGGGSYGGELSVSSVLGNVGEKIGDSENEGEREKVACKEVVREGKSAVLKGGGGGTFNTAKHLWAGAVAAMVSRTFVAPLERLKLEYIVRGEKRDLFELIKSIAASQGIVGFWKGNFVNILRTAPFKAINFYAYDTYRNQLLRLSGKDETTNFQRFLAGAAAGITATVLCILWTL
ncbi:UNVERIFIED_CONTAM: putative mitochondrial adenine nucleotide transporter BTL3 [Sesamum angustifolium]|uniref:Mitochondrial adenine nucleotide transporter BTL3 n=1 Tax=Sesamum angustifolium TaxID=2727405 RepID=A0AAW2J630_9LAMI